MFRKPKSKIKARSTALTNEALRGDDNSDEETTSRIQDVQEIQKFRQRPKGLDVIECALGKELAKELKKHGDPMRGTNFLQLDDARKAAINAADIENDIKEQFRKETLLRDEHEEMRKYVEQRLTSKADVNDSEIECKRQKFSTLEEEILFKAGEKVKKYTSTVNDELLSNQMLIGIPEIDLGIEARMKNIIETEQKKMELLKKQ